VTRRSFLLAATALASHLMPRPAAAAWPDHTIRLIVGFAPGGTADIMARQLQAPLAARLGQAVVVENHPGASGMTATSEVARAGADGATFLLAVSTHASLAAINRKLPYDVEKDFAPVIFIGSIPLVLLIDPRLAIRSLPELIAAAKEKPGALSYGFPGIGLSHHFAGELLKQRAGVDITAVSYRGTAPALNDVIAGQVSMTFGTLPAVMGAIKGGLVRPLAITAPARAEGLPDVPTVAESGYPDFDVSEWFGVIAPAATAPAVVRRLNAEIDAVLSEPGPKQWLRQNNVVRGPSTPEAFGARIVAEIANLTKVADKAGIAIE